MLLNLKKRSTFWLVIFAVLWAGLLISLPNTKLIIGDFAAFTFLGVLGAIFANATGAGGGVVFIPAFDQLDFTTAQSVATSFGIQCMGMVSGAIAWTRFYKKETQGALHQQWLPFKPSIMVVTPFAIIGMWIIYGADIASPGELKTLFGWFSVILGLAILLASIFLNHASVRSELTALDNVMLALVGLIGGAITAWLSVGVGEIMAIYLILRGVNITVAVASAVVVSAITVWAGIAEHVWFTSNLYWQVVLFAGPGAVLGAIIARQLATWLPVKKLKMFFALWILLMGLASLPSPF